MSNNNVFPTWIGGSFKLDAQMASPEVSLNMYPEKISGNAYSSMLLRSIEGSEKVLTISEAKIGCRGMYPATRGYLSQPCLWTVFDSMLYRVSNQYSYDIIGSIGSAASECSIVESGGVNPHVVVCNGNACLYVAPLLDSVSTVSIATTPYNVYNPKNYDANHNYEENVTVSPTCMVSMKDRIIINDSELGQVFVSRAGAFQGGTITIYDLDSDGNIQYESDGYTPIYKSVPAFSRYEWTDMKGAFNYITPMSNTGDTVLAMEVLNDNSLWFFGTRSNECWTFADDSATPQNQRQGTQIGIKSPHSLAKVENALIFLGSGQQGDNGVWIIYDSNEPKKISTVALERDLSTKTTSDAIAYGYSKDGHSFYCLTLPTSDVTYVYDLTTGIWHNRSSLDDSLNIDHCWFPETCCMFNGNLIFGTRNSNSLIKLSYEKKTDYNDRPIKKMRRGPVIISDLSRYILNDFRLISNNGTTTELQQDQEGYNPQVMFRVSLDGGNTWGNIMNEYLGMAGNYSYDTRISGLGSGFLICVEATVTDPIKWIITDSKIRTTQCRSF